MMLAQCNLRNTRQVRLMPSDLACFQVEGGFLTLCTPIKPRISAVLQEPVLSPSVVATFQLDAYAPSLQGRIQCLKRPRALDTEHNGPDNKQAP